MANSIEVRSPFLDYRLMEYSAKLPSEYKTGYKKGKLILRELAKRYLPDNIALGKKKGFAIPLDEWFRKDLGEMLSDLISSRNSAAGIIYSRSYIENILKSHQKKEGNYGELLWLFLSFEGWWKEYNV